VRKTAEIVEQLTGVRLTQGAITQDAGKQTQGPVGQRYGELRESVKQQAVIHTDDTGWRVGGTAAYLMAFVNQSLSVYQVRPRHRNEEVLTTGAAGWLTLSPDKLTCASAPVAD
jgi:hypothetical protein